MKKNLWDAAWLVGNTWVLFAVPQNGEMTGWDWFVFVWAAVNVAMLGFGLLRQAVDALFAYLLRDTEEHDAA